MMRCLDDFTTTFVLTPTATSDRVLCEVPGILAKDAHRKRRAHSKSNFGCKACRRRHVKCDEASPCSNCIQRREECEPRVRHKIIQQKAVRKQITERHDQAARYTHALALRNPTLIPSFTNDLPNLTDLQLFHHFQHHTRHTLLLPSAVWDTATTLSFTFPFLLHATLCISARHLAFLNPKRAEYYANLASTQLHRTLSGFRSGIASARLASSKDNIDVFIATALLLQFELWANTSYYEHGDGDGDEEDSYDPSKDAIFAYSASLKNTLQSCFKPSDVQRSTVMTHVVSDGTLGDVVNVRPDITAMVQNFFSHARSVPIGGFLPLIRPEPIANHNDDHHQSCILEEENAVYKPVIAALTPLLVQLSATQSRPQPPPPAKPITGQLHSKIARHILCFPVLCRGAFAAKVTASDPRALIILYHFFGAARKLLDGDEFWWGKSRAAAVERGLEKWVEMECG